MFSIIERFIRRPTGVQKILRMQVEMSVEYFFCG